VKNVVEGSSKMPATPSSILSDALGTFSKAANSALATVETQAAAEVARANAEAAEARQERDEAVDAMNAMRLEKKEWQRRVEGWKTSVDKSDMTIEHQNETIVQLREEANQWKGQLLRYEDTARREAQDWKEQYLRAEQERIRLAARVDELVNEQLAWNTQNNAHNAAYASGSRNHDLPNTTTPKRASTAVLPTHQRPGGSRSVPPVFDDYEDGTQVPRKPKASSSRPASTRADGFPRPRSPPPVAGPSSSRTSREKISEGRPDHIPITRPSTAPRASMSHPEAVRVIRRVQAVIEVPVKEESDDDGEGLLSDSVSSEYNPPLPKKTPQKAKVKRRSSVKSRKPANSSDDDDDREYEEPQKRQKARPTEVGSDDELVMGEGDDQQEVYGAHRILVTSEKDTPQRPRGSTLNGRSTATARKRKLDSDAAPAARGKASKVARK